MNGPVGPYIFLGVSPGNCVIFLTGVPKNPRHGGNQAEAYIGPEFEVCSPRLKGRKLKLPT